MKRYIRANMDEIPQKIKENNELIEKYTTLGNQLDVDDEKLDSFIDKIEQLRNDNSNLWGEFRDELGHDLKRNGGHLEYQSSNGDMFEIGLHIDGFGRGDGYYSIESDNVYKQFKSFNKLVDFILNYKR